MRPLTFTLVLRAPLLLGFASISAAQMPSSNYHDRVDQQLNGQRAALKAAIRSGDPIRRAAERASFGLLMARTGVTITPDNRPRALPPRPQRITVSWPKKRDTKLFIRPATKLPLQAKKVKLGAAYAEANLAHKRETDLGWFRPEPCPRSDHCGRRLVLTPERELSGSDLTRGRSLTKRTSSRKAGAIGSFRVASYSGEAVSGAD